MKIDGTPEYIGKLLTRIEELESVLVDLRYGSFQTIKQVNDLIDEVLDKEKIK